MAILLVEQNLGVATEVAERQLVMVVGPDRRGDDGRGAEADPEAPAALPRRRAARPDRLTPEEGGGSTCRTVVLVGTLDTKGQEYAYLADRLREHGVDVVLVDAGIVGEPLAAPDVTRDEVARGGRRRRRGARGRGRPRRGGRDDGARRGRGRQAPARRGPARRDRRPRRLGRLVARDLRDARSCRSACRS